MVKDEGVQMLLATSNFILNAVNYLLKHQLGDNSAETIIYLLNDPDKTNQTAVSVILKKPILVYAGNDQYLFAIVDDYLNVSLYYDRKCEIRYIPTKEPETPNIDKLILQCSSSKIRECIGKILQLSESDINLLLEEFDSKPDARFGDNLLYACEIVKRMKHDNDFYTLLRDI